MKQFKRNSKRVLALFLAMVMCLSMVQLTAFAVEDHVHNESGWSCTQAEPTEKLNCQHVHDPECGYVAAVEGVPCDCGAEADEDGVVIHDEGCSYVAPVEGVECSHACDDNCYTTIEGEWTCVPTAKESCDHEWVYESCDKLYTTMCWRIHDDNMVCSKCGAREVRSTGISGHSHDFVITSDAVDLGSIGDYDTDQRHTVKCTRCTAVETREHNFAPATCTAPETCACGHVKLNSQPLDHEWSDKWSKDDINHWHVCTRSGCTETSESAPHTWDGGVVTKEPTAAETGVKTFTCEVCDQTRTEDIPATGSTTVEVTEVTLNKDALSLLVGDTETLTATVTPEDASDKTVTWTSSDETVAAVNENGVVTAVAVGEATITAAAGEKSAACKVTVTEKEFAAKIVRDGEDYSFETLQAAVNDAKDNETVILLKDVTENVTAAGKTITLDLGGKTVTGTESSTVAVLTVKGGDVTLTGNGIITGGHATDFPHGGGVTVTDGGKFTMEDGTISGNTAKHNGGGVFVYHGLFTMEDGTIKDNDGGNFGGGVYVYNSLENMSGQFVMEDGTISHNHASSGGGVGASAWKQKEGRVAVILRGGIIEENTATNGGGIAVESTDAPAYANNFGATGQHKLEIGNVTICNNTAVQGGGVYSYEAITTITGASITGNHATGNMGGGGVRASGGTLDLADVTITGNDAYRGGGINIHNNFQPTHVTMESGTITGNTARQCGGGVYMYSGKQNDVQNDAATTSFTMTGGQIYGNTAASHSADVYSEIATLALADAAGGEDGNPITGWFWDGGGEYTWANKYVVKRNVTNTTANQRLIAAYDPRTVSLDRETLEFPVDSTAALIATVGPEGVHEKTRTVAWTSSNPAIATVDQNGVVTAVAVGTATITAAIGDDSAACEVTVIEPTIAVTGVTLNPNVLSLEAGSNGTLTATVTPEDASDKTVVWTSSNPAVATVDENGVVTAVAEGTATITAAVGDAYATCAVTVRAPVVAVTGLALDPAVLSLRVGGNSTLTATVTPENASDKTVTWTSSNPAVATVDENGVVTAVAEGTATITAAVGGQSATCAVTVSASTGGGTTGGGTTGGDDVPEVDVPEVDVPEVDVPVVDVPEVDVPMEETPVVDDEIRMPDAPETAIPDTDVPLAETPEVTIPEEDVPMAEVPEEVIPDAEVPQEEIPEVVIPDEDVPLAEAPEVIVLDEDMPLAEMPEVIILEEDVPLADVPQTGEESTAFWMAAVLMSGAALVYLNTRKRKEENQ